MRCFRDLFTSALALSAAVSSVAALSAADLVKNIDILTAKSRDLQVPAQTITLINGPLIAVNLGPFPKIISGFTEIVSIAAADISAMQNGAQITNPADAAAVADAFRTFVVVHQQLLNILIGKAGLFTLVPFVGEPVAQALRAVEKVVDTIAFSLIDQVQSQATDISNQNFALKNTIEKAIGSYEGLVPVPRPGRMLIKGRF